MSETALIDRLIKNIGHDFEIRREVPGYHPMYKKNVRIDLMLKARSHLQEAGFTNEWFGVECKWSDAVQGATSKFTRMVWQSITYAQSKFLVDGEHLVPSFVAVYTPDNLDRIIESHLETLLSLGLYGNVGRLYFYRDLSWGIKFASIYARSSPNGFHMSHNQLPARRAGSI
ncbi:hypothetical protein [Pseudomonas lurida]|uniref:hypothetical protein n=1 Tax=Pseudomonas lurida TaxID=244566 RepID=UPI001645455E|nr:hypothetical protein [Pseudomonas lurida]MBC3234161.1 hypothetical protein [Pseudomonas lurida]